MKKPKPRHRRSSTKRKATHTRSRGAAPTAKRRRVVVASSIAAAALVVGGTLAYDAWNEIQNSAPRDRIAAGADADEIFKEDAAAQRGSDSPTLAAARGDSPVSGLAKVQIDEDSLDLGTMAVSEERSADFALRNAGGEPLEISQVRTSCMCTFAQVIIGGEESPAFNMEMHNAPSVQRWKGIIDPGATATVRLTYKPSLMPVEGPVARNVKFNTSDPARPIVELGIQANVQ